MANIPKPIQIAHEALDILRADDAALADSLSKVLPSYALRLEKQGKDFDVQSLVADAKNGAIDSVVQNDEPKKKLSYHDIANSLKEAYDFITNIKTKIQTYTIEELRKLSDNDHLYIRGEDVEQTIESAAKNKDPEVFSLFISCFSVSAKELNPILIKVCSNKYYEDQVRIVRQLVDAGAELSALPPEDQKLWGNRLQTIKKWQQDVRTLPPLGCEDYSPQLYRPQLFDMISQALATEGYQEASEMRNKMAFNAAALFSTENRLLEYLQAWAKPSKQPLHDIIQHIKLPVEGSYDLKAWGDAVLKHGPDMAKLTSFADKIPQPLKSSDGKTWSLSNTRDEVSKFAYKNGDLNPALSGLCYKHQVSEECFERALGLISKSPAKKNIPDVAIDGKAFDMEGAKFYRLPANDVRGPFLGKLVNCCQSIGGHGEECAEHGISSKDSGFYVVEDAKGAIIGETWAWRGTHDEICFDSLETLGNRVSGNQWKKILRAYADELTKKNDHKIASFTVGLDGGTPSDIAKAFKKCATPAKPKKYKGYTDSDKQIVVWTSPSL